MLYPYVSVAGPNKHNDFCPSNRPCGNFNNNDVIMVATMRARLFKCIAQIGMNGLEKRDTVGMTQRGANRLQLSPIILVEEARLHSLVL